MRSAALLLAAGLLAAAGPAPRTFTMGVAGDLLTLDPHGANQTFTQVMLGSVYEGLVRLDENMRAVPALATAWPQPAPDVWRFTLRPSVTFHDGTPLTADDVVFSFARVALESSNIRASVAAIKEVRAPDPATTEITTKGPAPILPREIPFVYVMSRAWAAAHQAESPSGVRTDRITYATMHTNGTGPFRLVERTPDTSTVLERNPAWWDTSRHPPDRAVIRPIGTDGTRLAAIAAGDVDLIQGVPLQALDPLRANPALTVAQASDLRTLFLGMDQASAHLPGQDQRSNPFRDVRVRRAVYQAIDIGAIHQRVMRGLSRPAGEMVAPPINGYDAAQDVRLPHGPAASKARLTEAGFPDGFSVVLDCPVGRLVNDEAICRAIVPMLARIGIKVELNARTFALFSQAVLARKTSFYLQSWLPPSGDALNTLVSVMATPGNSQGTFNSGSYGNPALDALLPQIQTEMDPARRNALMLECLEAVAPTGKRISLHAEENSIMVRRETRMRAAGRSDPLAHLASRPALVAVEAVSRAALLAEWTGARVHVLHISSAKELRPLAEAKARGVDITGETCPQYLFLSTEEYAAARGVIRVNPPVREARNHEPLLAALRSGLIDMIATDHAPHTPEQKTRDNIWTVDCGFPGVETQMPLMLTAVAEGRASLGDYARWSAVNPAKVWGLYPRKGVVQPGADADLALVDLGRCWTIDDQAIQSRSKISPWHGRRVTGLPVHTIVRGRFVMRDRHLVENARGWGRPVHGLQQMPPAVPRHQDTTMAAILATRPRQATAR